MSAAGMAYYSLETSRDRLGIATVLAVVVHTILILGVGFGVFDSASEDELPPTLDVTLVNTRSDEIPKSADFFAQANQEGGGQSQEVSRPESMFQPLYQKENLEVTSLDPDLLTPAPRQRITRRELMTQSTSDQSMSADLVPVEKTESQQESTAQLISRSMEIASLELELERSIQTYAKMPRKKVISAATREHRFAAYMDSWRRKVERTGTLYYPVEAKRRNLSGSLTMTVVVLPNGTIKQIKITRSSGHKLLDDAAMNIVHMAAPFPPFPDNIRKDKDELHIIRTWQFLSNGSTLRSR